MHIQLLIGFVLLGIATSYSSLDWIKFKRDFKKSYQSWAEEQERKQIFLENVNRMRDFQQFHPNATFTVAINHLADRRIEELVSSSAYHAIPLAEDRKRPRSCLNLPDSLDWRTKGVISPVKNEGVLGQVSAIVAVEVIETLNAILTGKLVAGSVARVVDCCPQPADPFQCIKKLGGVCAQADYPTPTGQCAADKCKPVITFNSARQLKNQDEDTMVEWIQNSTLYVGIDASRSSFQLYQSGIYNDPSCSKTMIDHLLQLVGYGKTSSGEIYWICKNSWGTSWGEQGYVRILRGHDTCGIAGYVVQVE